MGTHTPMKIAQRGRGWATFTGLAATLSAAQAAVLTPVVEVGDSAPGFAPGTVYEDFGIHPDVEEGFGTSTVSRPSIDREGNIGFHAFVGDDGVVDPVDLFTLPDAPAGVFRVVAGQPELIARIDEPAPGTQALFRGFPDVFPVAPTLASGLATFTASTASDAFAPATGVWSDRSGAIEPIARLGDILPGTDLALSFVSGATIDGVTRIVGRLGGNTSGRSDGLWRLDDAGALEPLAVLGRPAPGFEDGVAFGRIDHTSPGVVGSFDFNASGRAVVAGTVAGPGIVNTEDEAIWIEGESGLEIFLREGMPVPKGFFKGNVKFESGSTSSGAFVGSGAPPVRINDSGEIVFFAQVDPGKDARIPTLWTTRGGTLDLFLRGSQRFVQGAVPGDPAPGIPDATFTFFSFADINDRGDIMVRAAAARPETDIYSSLGGVWVDRGGGLEPVGVEEASVPGVPGATFISFGSSFLEHDGSVVFIADFFDGATFGRGAFANTPGSGTRLIVREGGEVEVAGRGTRTVTKFTVGRDASDDGLKVLEVEFADGASGLYTVALGGQAPEPVCETDLNGDGATNVLDFAMFATGFGQSVEPGTSGDFNADGVVTVLDFSIFAADFGCGG